MFGRKRKARLAAMEPARRFPERSTFDVYMCDWLAYYKAAGYKQWRFFSPYCGEYFPLSAATGFSYDEGAKALYKAMKVAYPDLVAEARRNHPDTPVQWSTVGDYEDYKNE